MRLASLYVVAISFLFAGNTYARGPISEPVAQFYLSIPLGDVNKKTKQPVFGFTLDRKQVSYPYLNRSNAAYVRPPLLDVKFNQSGMQSLNVSGFDFSKIMLINNIDDERGTGSQVYAGAAVAAVFGMIVIINVVEDTAEDVIDTIIPPPEGGDGGS